MNDELLRRFERVKTIGKIKKCVKALYLVGELRDVVYYLDTLVDNGVIDYEDCDNIFNDVENECSGLTVGEINNAVDNLINMKRTLI